MESTSLDFTGLKIPRDYPINKEDNHKVSDIIEKERKVL